MSGPFRPKFSSMASRSYKPILNQTIRLHRQPVFDSALPLPGCVTLGGCLKLSELIPLPINWG